MYGMHMTYGSKLYVKHITKEAVKDVKIIFFPIIHNQHWILLVLDLKLRKWRIYDSLPNQMHKAGATEVINMFARDAADVFTTKIHKWFISITKHVPSQRNSFDCGMFVCKYMETLVQIEKVDWSAHMD
ncbi:ubiquitin-like-specific protease 1A [Phalaenopsis equestris]|uniref:ubiquitin-like-specific protease 1A n=1 Tax=Phalaenopsis equestris TaxID=78828 RepID=UPI0009E2E162|nr:ubiquitin-like-specific protease 1A [Phalaenopsis equestris]